MTSPSTLPTQDGCPSGSDVQIEIKRDGKFLRSITCREFVLITVRDDLDHEIVTDMDSMHAVFMLVRALVQAVKD